MALVCAACGNTITTDDKFCRVCGRMVSAAPFATPSLSPSVPPGTAKTSGKAVTSLICGLLFFVPLLFVVAIVFGHLALAEIKRSAGRLKGEGIAIAGMVLGYLWIPAIPVFLIIAAIAIPNLLRARMAANESSAVGSVRILNTAELAYAAAHPELGYTCMLSDLAEARNLATGQKNGYRFELSGCSPGTEGGPNVKYQAVAYPLRVNQTGVRAFCSDESAVIKQDSGGSAQACIESGEALR